MDEDGLVYLEEDLRLFCIEEIVVFCVFVNLVEWSSDEIVVIDMVLIGYMLFFFDVMEEYYKEIVCLVGVILVVV